MEKLKGQIILSDIEEKLSFDVAKEDVKMFINELIDNPNFLEEFKKNPIDQMKKMGIEVPIEAQKKIEEGVSKPITLLTQEEYAQLGAGTALVVVAVYTASDGPVY